ncbi:MAG: hypothetical protein ACM3JJ_02805 [Hyphomicrobiales bacterium]
MPADATLRGVARVAALALLLAAAAAVGGCAKPDAGPPRIARGTPCSACGMEVRDLRFACAVRAGSEIRVYDSIECALHGGAGAPGSRVYLADFLTAALHEGDSLWVVRGDIPSPMGGGYAAFLDRTEAERVATARAGRTARFAAFLAPSAAEASR